MDEQEAEDPNAELPGSRLGLVMWKNKSFYLKKLFKVLPKLEQKNPN